MKKAICMCILAALAMLGCAEYTTVEKQAASPVPYDVNVGDSVVVVLVNDDYHEFKVTEISESEIAGGDIRIAYDDIAFVKRKGIDTDETIKSVLAGTGLGLLIALTGLMLLAIAVL
jgi:hypothetical protein